jgi:hypothetical protein
MINEDLSGTERLDEPEPAIEMVMVAIAEVVRLTLALGSANATLAFAEAVRIRGELEHALPHAQLLAERIADGCERAAALRDLGDMQAVATRALMIAPSPSMAAVSAAEAGDPRAWLVEEQAWINVRLANGSSPRLVRHRTHRPTRPESPHALHDISADARDVDDPTSEPPLTHQPNRART